MTHDYRIDHSTRYAHDKATEAGKGLGITNSEYSNGRRTSYRLTEYWDFWLRAKAETEERNAQRSKR